MHYVGTLTNGKKFDSSRDRGKPFTTTIGVGQVIRGWDEGTYIIKAREGKKSKGSRCHQLNLGVPKMSLGEVARLTCSPDYAYGNRGFDGLIPPNSTLVFEVELLKIN